MQSSMEPWMELHDHSDMNHPGYMAASRPAGRNSRRNQQGLRGLISGGLIVLALVIVPHLIASPSTQPRSTPKLADHSHSLGPTKKTRPLRSDSASQKVGKTHPHHISTSTDNNGVDENANAKARLLHKWTHSGHEAVAEKGSKGANVHSSTSVREQGRAKTKTLIDGLRKGALLKPGTTEWERRSDNRFFDHIDTKRVPGQEQTIRDGLKSVWQTERARAQERAQEEEWVRGQTRSRAQRDEAAQAAARKSAAQTFASIDSHRESIKQQSVQGWKSMEAQSLAREVERENPNMTPEEIAKRSMRLLNSVIKDRGRMPAV